MSAVDRAADLLDALARNGGYLGVVELSEAVGQPAPSTHRLLALLALRGYVLQNEDTKRYGLGPAVLRLAQAYQSQNPLIEGARERLAALSNELGESVFLAQMVDGKVVCVATSEAARPVPFFMRLGQQMPIHASASGRAIIAFQPPAIIESFLATAPYEQFTESTVTAPGELARVLDATRGRGFALCEQEIEDGVTAIAFPIRDAAGAVVASLAAVAPHQRLTGERLDRALTSLRPAAEAISAKLGYVATVERQQVDREESLVLASPDPIQSPGGRPA